MIAAVRRLAAADGLKVVQSRAGNYDRNQMRSRMRERNYVLELTGPDGMTIVAPDSHREAAALKPGPIKGGRSRCEFEVNPRSHISACGQRATYWDGKRYLCNEHKPDQKQAAGTWVKHQIKASDIQVGDRLDSAGKTRVDQRHPRTDKVLVRTQTTGTRSPSVSQWDNDETINVWRRP